MAELILNNDEAEMLKEVLESYLSDLRMEIVDTDLKNFRDDLKAKEVFLKDMISRLMKN
ncbi:MAG: hypothetical protein ACE5EZ_06270 [Thermodesulfobacteriota bacterium]